MNWNQASRSAIRTTLGAKPAAAAKTQVKSAFDTVNDKFFRSRSASVSEEEAPSKDDIGTNNPSPKVDQEPKTYYVDDSDASDSGEVSEGDDSMMLNIGQQSNGHGLDGAQDEVVDLSTPPFVVDTLPSAQFNQPDTQETGSVLSEWEIYQQLFVVVLLTDHDFQITLPSAPFLRTWDIRIRLHLKWKTFSKEVW